MNEVVDLARRIGIAIIPGEPKMLLVARIRQHVYGKDPHIGPPKIDGGEAKRRAAESDYTDHDWWHGKRRDYMEDKRWRRLFTPNSKRFKRAPRPPSSSSFNKGNP